MDQPNYKPDETSLLKYVGKFRPFLLVGQTEPDFDHKKFLLISKIIRDKKLPEELLGDFYWIVSNHLTTSSLLKSFQKISDSNLEVNRQLVDAAKMVQLARREKWSISVSIKAKRKSALITDTALVNLVIEQLEKEQSGLLLDKTDFEQEQMAKSCTKINSYLSHKGISTASLRYRIIGYLLIIAGMPLYHISNDRKKIQYDLDDKDFDESAMIDTVKQTIKRAK
ncbi:MAG: hypothetical protein AABY93_08945 [Bacteroidota bacterium]